MVGKLFKRLLQVVFTKKREVNFKNKKNFRRHLIKVHVCGNCDDICYTRTESKVHVHTFHEGNDDNEVKKKAKSNRRNRNLFSDQQGRPYRRPGKPSR